MSTSSYIQVNYPEPHLARTRKILSAHPEIRKFYGPSQTSLLWITFIVLFQIGMAFVMGQSPWWVILLISYTFGAIANHALFVFIHECTHNLVLKTTTGNCWATLFCNMPLVFPGAIPFRKFHLLHHRYQGELDKDADLPGPKEAAWIGGSLWRKALWLFFFAAVEGIVRPVRLKQISIFDRWFFASCALQILFLGVLGGFFGWGGIAYLFFSFLFSVGLHPVGARWIQEHYVVTPNQETYSYYGRLSPFIFHVGHHNEHHDFISVPWFRLPAVRAMAPEFYNSLTYHTSYIRLLWRFLTDRNFTLFNRIVRPGTAPSYPKNELRRTRTKFGAFELSGTT